MIISNKVIIRQEWEWREKSIKKPKQFDIKMYDDKDDDDDGKQWIDEIYGILKWIGWCISLMVFLFVVLFIRVYFFFSFSVATSFFPTLSIRLISSLMNSPLNEWYGYLNLLKWLSEWLWPLFLSFFSNLPLNWWDAKECTQKSHRKMAKFAWNSFTQFSSKFLHCKVKNTHLFLCLSNR